MPGVADALRLAMLTGASYRVHGPVALYVGDRLPILSTETGRTLDTPVPLGVTTGELSIKFNLITTSIETSAGGAGVPAEFAAQGVTAALDFKLGTAVPDTLAELLGRAAGVRGRTSGQAMASGGPGKLVGSGLLAFRLIIDHPTQPIRFLCCKQESRDLPLSTDFSKHGLRLMAWSFVPGGYLTSGPDTARPTAEQVGVSLYDHTAA